MGVRSKVALTYRPCCPVELHPRIDFGHQEGEGGEVLARAVGMGAPQRSIARLGSLVYCPARGVVESQAVSWRTQPTGHVT